MYGRSNPVRDCASCAVATPSSPSVRIASVSARWIFRMIVGLTFLLASGPHPRRERTLTPRRGYARPRLGAPPQRGCRAGGPGVAAGAPVRFQPDPPPPPPPPPPLEPPGIATLFFS